jgi:hypothetical protein
LDSPALTKQTTDMVADTHLPTTMASRSKASTVLNSSNNGILRLRHGCVFAFFNVVLSSEQSYRTSKTMKKKRPWPVRA